MGFEEILGKVLGGGAPSAAQIEMQNKRASEKERLRLEQEAARSEADKLAASSVAAKKMEAKRADFTNTLVSPEDAQQRRRFLKGV